MAAAPLCVGSRPQHGMVSSASAGDGGVDEAIDRVKARLLHRAGQRNLIHNRIGDQIHDRHEKRRRGVPHIGPLVQRS